MTINIAQGKSAIIAEILQMANRPMSLKEISETMISLGVETDDRAYMHTASYLKKRMRRIGDIERCGHGMYRYFTTYL